MIAGSFYKGFIAINPQYQLSYDQFGTMLDSIFGGHREFMEMYPRTQEVNPPWWIDLYTAISGIEYEPEEENMRVVNQPPMQ